MGKKNDQRILELKGDLAEKRNELGKKDVKFVPITNCVIKLNGMTYNLHTCDSETLTMLLIKLNVYKLSAKDLGVEAPKFNGYSLEDWMNDIRSRLEALKVSDMKKQIAAAEKRLDGLLSEDKRTEMQISEIVGMLKGLDEKKINSKTYARLKGLP